MVFYDRTLQLGKFLSNFFALLTGVVLWSDREGEQEHEENPVKIWQTQ